MRRSGNARLKAAPNLRIVPNTISSLSEHFLGDPGHPAPRSRLGDLMADDAKLQQYGIDRPISAEKKAMPASRWRTKGVNDANYAANNPRSDAHATFLGDARRECMRSRKPCLGKNPPASAIFRLSGGPCESSRLMRRDSRRLRKSATARTPGSAYARRIARGPEFRRRAFRTAERPTSHSAAVFGCCGGGVRPTRRRRVDESGSGMTLSPSAPHGKYLSRHRGAAVSNLGIVARLRSGTPLAKGLGRSRLPP